MAYGDKRDAGSVLLELLEIVPDAGKLERMLEPANLLHILMSHGRDRDDIVADLKTRLPGELLLEVLRAERDPDALLSLCAAPVERRGAGLAGLAGLAGAADADPFGEASFVNKASSFALLFAVIIPAMVVAGFFPAWESLSFGGWLSFATAGAAVAGAGYVWGRAPWYVGALGGALVAPGALLAIYHYTYWRTTVLRLEIVLAFFVGALPGIVAYYVLFKKVAGDARRPH